ncbi:serine/threonine protein kinase [Rhizobium leguminosarum bv. trifolii]|uniref:serine/threonine-protein kinase n=1 Tax=Rhizobium leguminosarum TaxID=384 RepID=UPI00140FA282|nr:serine/threonine protein kinase [Rhizobium leguminosarum bv. trifolii]
MEVKLERGVWTLDESAPLGPPGGFGEVFRGRGEIGDVAIKRLKLTADAAAHREMSIGRGLADRKLGYVVPIFDYGQDSNSDRYYLVMPICEYSLQDYLKKKGALDWESTKPIALDILAGLIEVNDIVHRDLKPGNVLWYQGRWRIADFGIAKFVEDSTSLQTLRNSLTPQYGAPEQWQGEAPTRATDIYALGCILHAMMNGRPPFLGDMDAIRRSHLSDQPPDLLNAPVRLKGLVAHMLRKTLASRPSAERCQTVIADIESVPSRKSHELLAAAGKVVSEADAKAEAAALTEETAKREKARQTKEAIQDLEQIVGRLFGEIQQSSESVKRSSHVISLGPAKLTFNAPSAYTSSGKLVFDPGWDVLAYSSLSLSCQQAYVGLGDDRVYTFSASLVYSRTRDDSEYRWREVSFWGFSSDRSRTPFSLSPSDREFGVALSNVAGMTSVAHGPLSIDAEDEQTFQERWMRLFARAAHGRLSNPNQMPPPPQFFA